VHFILARGQASLRLTSMTRLTLPPGSITITLNGAPRHVPPGTTVAELLRELDLNPRFLAVERNFGVVPRAEHGKCRLEEGDRLEIVTLVGGG
jgi:sulfur carrier protein